MSRNTVGKTHMLRNNEAGITRGFYKNGLCFLPWNWVQEQRQAQVSEKGKWYRTAYTTGKDIITSCICRQVYLMILLGMLFKCLVHLKDRKFYLHNIPWGSDLAPFTMHGRLTKMSNKQAKNHLPKGYCLFLVEVLWPYNLVFSFWAQHNDWKLHPEQTTIYF